MKITNCRAIHLVYIWLIVFSFVPIAMMTAASFLSKNSVHLMSLPLTLSNYQQLLSPVFLNVFGRSVWLAFITTGLCLLFAYPFSYFLVKSKYQSIMLLLIVIPFWTSSLVRTYALLSILKFNGILNQLLMMLHIIHQPIPFLYTQFAVVSGLVYNLFPFMVLPIFTNMELFDSRWIEAAKDLGASRWVIFFRVFLPNTLRGVFSGCLFVFLPAMTFFYIPNILGGSRSILLGNMIQTQFLVLEDWPQGSATSMFLTFILLILMGLSRIRNRKRRIST